MKLFVDDVRDPPDDDWTIARSSGDALAVLNLRRLLELDVDHISLDHDLGGDDTTRPVMLWFAENEWWPKRLTIHTANPVGREFLAGTARRYGPEGMLT